VPDVFEENELDPDLNLPSTPSELRAMPDADFFRLASRMGYVRGWGKDRRIDHEMTARLIRSLTASKKAADRSALTLNVLTAVLVVLTIVLVVYTVRAD